MGWNKEQGMYRLKKAVNEITILVDSIKEDDMDKDDIVLQIDEIRWLVQKGIEDFQDEKPV